MTEDTDKMDQIMFERETEDAIAQIILACGKRQLKEKVTLLYLTIDYIFEHNKELIPYFCDEKSLH
jgi:hypothetical protein